jgi:hypothetical protein
MRAFKEAIRKPKQFFPLNPENVSFYISMQTNDLKEGGGG